MLHCPRVPIEQEQQLSFFIAIVHIVSQELGVDFVRHLHRVPVCVVFNDPIRAPCGRSFVDFVSEQIASGEV